MALLGEISEVTWVTSAIIILTSLGLICSLFRTSDPYNRFPRVGLPWYLSFLPSKPVHKLVEDGYNELKGPFVVRWWALDWLVLGPEYLADLRHCESASLSFFQVISKALRLEHSVGNLYHNDRMTYVIKKGMNSQLPALTPIVIDEIENAFASHIGRPQGTASLNGQCHGASKADLRHLEWQEVPVADAVADLTNQVACRVLICRELSRNAQFLKRTMTFQHSIFMHAVIIISLPFGPFRRLFSPIISLSHRWNMRKAMAILQPVVARRIRNRTRNQSLSEEENDGIAWTLDQTSEDEMDPKLASLEILHNLFAGSLAPGAMITEMVFQVLMDPKLLADLRDEAMLALEEHGWTEKLLRNLALQDSFIRELNRLYPTGATGCSRLVVDKNFTFSNGLTVRQGTRLTFPIMAIMKENERLANPGEFDAYRFLKLRDVPHSDDGGTEYQWVASSISPANLMFGYGKHACPGRYYCIRQAKLIFTKLLVDYDIEWTEPGMRRPQRETIEGQFGPNRAQRMRLRWRGVAKQDAIA
ncbi:cytochrome P450 [Xylaria digitata]|nr:cytochrome P450 [Xylaria digitata]